MREENYTRVAGQERSDCPFPEESLYNTEEKEDIVVGYGMRSRMRYGSG